ncbi:IS5 family transposase [Saccharomonospora piscinae]|uniref:IS5 family transposase n=1 Tax=Saccharomonospora piscinae TaxID=687388 RepID=A0A1V8ZY14_SACPI|nr:IS5 family transposase [Saccharomonospora piscinae]
MGVPWVASDELWTRIEQMLPVRPAGRTGPKPLPDRLVLQGIVFVRYTGIGWEDLPQELGFGSGMTCWRRLRDWQEAGVFDRLHEVLLAELNAAAVIDRSRACVDASQVRAKRGPGNRAESGRGGQRPTRSAM